MPTLRGLRLISRWQAHKLTPGAKRGKRADAYNLALALERLGRDEEAEHWYRQFADRDTDHLCNLGLLLARTEREQEALTLLAAGAEQGDADCAYNAATVCEDIGDKWGALSWYKQAARLGDVDAAKWLRTHQNKAA